MTFLMGPAEKLPSQMKLKKFSVEDKQLQFKLIQTLL